MKKTRDWSALGESPLPGAEAALIDAATALELAARRYLGAHMGAFPHLVDRALSSGDAVPRVAVTFERDGEARFEVGYALTGNSETAKASIQ